MMAVTKRRKKLVIIDGKSVFYRGYYAMPNLSKKDGTPTGGVYGFAVMALEVLKRLEPDFVCVAWDKPKTNIRKRIKLYPAYKAGRKPAPADFYEQIPLLHRLLKAFDWPLYELDDYEADDIMGSLAVQATSKGIDTLLVTSDLDLLQVINDSVNVYALKKGLSNIELYHPESFKEKYGIEVGQFLDLKSLKGDSSDNIPGVPGVGEKTAVKLINQYKTLDGIYENLDLITPTKLAEKLRDNKDLAYLSKKLASIWLDAPIKLNLDDVDANKCNPALIQEILVEYEFKTLARQLPEFMSLPEKKAKNDASQLVVPKQINIKTAQQLSALQLPLAKEVVIISESDAHGQNIKSLSISPNDSSCITLDLGSLNKKDVTDKLKDYVEKAKLVGYDLKSTLQALMGLQIFSKKIAHDVQVGAFLLDPLSRSASLEELSADKLAVHLPSKEEGGRPADSVSIIRKLWQVQKIELEKQPKLVKLAREIDWPLIPVIASMENRGILLDVDYLNKFEDRLRDTLSDLEQQIYGHADKQFNIASPAQLAEVLFDELKLPTKGIKKGKTGFSTAASELDKLRFAHPIINFITQYREVAKLMNTYVEPLPNQVDSHNRLHTTYNLTIASTGRLSSERPNLQNIPVRSSLGREIRTSFIAGEGKALISADYSQIELRVAALLSKDEQMIDMFNRDVDIHRATAAEVYGRELEDVTKNMRRDAKVINFGVMYGLSPHGLSSATGMTFEASKKFIDKYFEIRPKLVAYIEALKVQAKDQGYVETLFGRRRPTPDVKSSNFMVRESAIRAAINMPFQGTAADIMKIAMINLDKELAKHDDAHMLLQIHDSVLVECPEENAGELAKEIKRIMETAVKLDIKLTADVEIGKNWGEL